MNQNNRFTNIAAATALALVTGFGFATTAAPQTRTESVAPKVAAKPAAPTAAQLEIEKTIRNSGLDQTVKSLMNEETVGLFFSMMRAAISDKGADIPPQQENKMVQLATDLPKKIAPVMAKVLDVAEQEVKRAMREQTTADSANAQKNTPK
jgi:hypothetical protein